MKLSVFAAPPPARLAPYQQWFLLAELRDVALAAPHRRAIEILKAPQHGAVKHLKEIS